MRLHPVKYVKPKFHAFVIHVVSDALRVGKVLSCFVTERKHRATKRAGLFVFRAIDNVVARDLLSKQCDAFRGDLLVRDYLVNPRNLLGNVATYAKQAVIHCGAVRFDDLVMTVAGDVGRVIRFFSSAAGIVVQLEVYELVCDVRNIWAASTGRFSAYAVDDIVDALTWYQLDDAIVRVIKPVHLLV